MDYEPLQSSPLRCVYATMSLMVEMYAQEIPGHASMSIASDTLLSCHREEGRQANWREGRLAPMHYWLPHRCHEGLQLIVEARKSHNQA